MDLGLVSADWAPLVTLLETILNRLHNELGKPEPLFLSIDTGWGREVSVALTALAAIGAGADLVEAQVDDFGGPVLDAINTGLPFAVTDIWSDPRWPRLTHQSVSHLESAAAWTRIRGMAVLPVGHLEHSMIVLSCGLIGGADEHTLSVLGRYKQLVESAIAVVAATATDGPEQVLRILTGRASIEQAKGAIVAVTGEGPEAAWRTLRRASQRHNVKLRDLATALVEYLGRERAERLVGIAAPLPDPAAEKAARILWRELMTPSTYTG